jgi:hypothetical protein
MKRSRGLSFPNRSTRLPRPVAPSAELDGETCPGERAKILELPVERLQARVEAFNRGVQPGSFDHNRLNIAERRGT